MADNEEIKPRSEELKEQVVMEPSPALQGKESTFAVIKHLASSERRKQLSYVVAFASLIFTIVILSYNNYLDSIRQPIWSIDGAGTLHVGILEELDKDNSIFQRLGLDASLGAFERTPKGFRLPEYMDFYYSTDAKRKMQKHLDAQMIELKKKDMKQEANPEIVKFVKVVQHKGLKAYAIQALVNIERRYIVGRQLVTEPDQIVFFFYAIPNPKLSERRQFPFIVDDFVIEKYSNIEQ